MPLQATSGAASYDGFGGGAAAVNYIEDVFSTYLYTGTGANQTFNNGVDLSTKGGMVWIKQRSSPAEDWRCVDSARGITNGLQQNLTNAQQDWTGLGYVTSFNTNGFSIGTNVSINTNAYAYASWTFRKQPKFFDVVTYTGTGSTLVVNHNLNSLPGFVIIKRTNTTGSWVCYHRSRGFNEVGFLNSTNAFGGGSAISASTTTTVTVPAGDSETNASGSTYVMYLFAHDAGGFGLSGSDNVISCGSYTGNALSAGPTITLGYEPQWVLIKRATGSAQNWVLMDTMRGMPVNSNGQTLFPNLSNEENNPGTTGISPTATGFAITNANDLANAAGETYIYIAIRRGPMKTPTSGTSVFSPVARSGTSANTTVAGSSGVSDLAIIKNRNTVITQTPFWAARITYNNFLLSSATDAQSGAGTAALQSNPWDVMSGVKVGTGGAVTVTNASGQEYINYLFTRAPGFFDVVCYTGTGANRTVSHNLGVVPEMMIFKRRDTTANWRVYHSSQPASDLGILNSTSFFQTDTNVLNSTAPTASVFTVGTNAQTNASGGTYVAYLFATVAGVSKVGSYTGTGTTKQIDCGFTGGARFVLIKRVDDSGDWYVWDSARGIVAGNDPYLLLNSTAAEVTGTDYVDTLNAGFEISSTAPAAINANGGTFIFLAIA